MNKGKRERERDWFVDSSLSLCTTCFLFKQGEREGGIFAFLHELKSNARVVCSAEQREKETLA